MAFCCPLSSSPALALRSPAITHIHPTLRGINGSYSASHWLSARLRASPGSNKALGTSNNSGAAPTAAVETASSPDVPAGDAGDASTSSASSSSKNASRTVASRQAGQHRTAQTAAISVSGPYITTSSVDGDSMVMNAEFLERELMRPYRFNEHQKDIIHELAESMKGCSTAFVAVAVAGIALTVAASYGVPMEDAPEVLFNGITVGDVASWVDSLLVAYLLNFGAQSFKKVEKTCHEERQLAYTFQGINRLGLMFTQFSIAATTVSIVTTLEAASKWPPLVTLASGLFFLAAVGRSGAMWYVLNKYGTTLDDVDAALEAQRRAYQAAHDEQLPLADRLAIRLAFSYLLQYSSAGRRPSEVALSSAASAVTAAVVADVPSAAAEDTPTGVVAEVTITTTHSSSGASSSSNSSVMSSAEHLGNSLAAAAVAVRAGGRNASAVATRGMELLRKIPLPIIKSTDLLDDDELAEQRRQQQQYVLTQAEERLVQASQSSLNNAGLALVMQAVATGLLVTANVANEDYSSALADMIQVANKAIAAELIFVATTNFDKALYTEGCDVEHLLEGLGHKGITRLFHNLSILAWAVVIAKGVGLLAPWEENSPLFKFISENFSHQAADMVLEGQELLVNMIQ